MSSSSQAESCSNGGLSPYVQMLVSFGNVPEWHNLLSALFIWLITTGFITIPPALITVVENNNQSTQTGNGQTSADNNNQPSQTGDGNPGLLLQFALSEPLFAIGVSIFFVGLIGMVVLSRYRNSNQIALKDNYFWLYHKYYHRVAEGGLYGLISLLVSIFVLGNNTMDPPTIAVICVTCVITTLFIGLAGWSYVKTRQARKAHETPQPQAEKPQTSA